MATNDPTSVAHDIHRAFIQALFAHQVLTRTQIQYLLSNLHTAHTPNRPTLPNDITQPDIDEAVQRANDALSAYDFELRSARPQLPTPAPPTPRATTNNTADDDRIYALVNTTSDAPTQLATHRRPEEIAYVRRLLDAVFDTYNTRAAELCAVPSMAALELRRVLTDDAASAAAGRRVSSSAAAAGAFGSGTQLATQQTQAGGGGSGQSLTFSAVERVLDDLVAEKWLVLSAKGYYSLAPRALMELKGWLVETYNDPAYEDEEDDMEGEGDDSDGEGGARRRYVKIKFCAACREIVTVGQRCPDVQCLCRMHHACVARKFRAQGGNEACPTCGVAWQVPGIVGEKAARRPHGERHADGGGTGRSGRRSTRHEDDDDEPMDE